MPRYKGTRREKKIEKKREGNMEAGQKFQIPLIDRQQRFGYRL